MFYKKELEALKKSGRYRTRTVESSRCKDFASNDYLGLAHKKDLHKNAAKRLSSLDINTSKASMLINGYHQVHKDFEEALCRANKFEAGVVLGSGFNANIALIEALVRKGDTLYMDELYHASGVLASNIGGINVLFFKHNDMQELEELLKNSSAKRKIVAVEGIYSMNGDLCDKDIFRITTEHNALLIVDEAHSSGVIGKQLMGLFDYYGITPAHNHIKMGTLGKAYGSFGAFILASKHIIEYLINRAKPIIYATSLSLYDTLLAHESLCYILKNTQEIQREIALRQTIIKEELGIEVQGLIVPFLIANNKKVIEIKDRLYSLGYSVGAIRQPTVASAIIRLIARVGESSQELRTLCKNLVTIVQDEY